MYRNPKDTSLVQNCNLSDPKGSLNICAALAYLRFGVLRLSKALLIRQSLEVVRDTSRRAYVSVRDLLVCHDSSRW